MLRPGEVESKRAESRSKTALTTIPRSDSPWYHFHTFYPVTSLIYPINDEQKMILTVFLQYGLSQPQRIAQCLHFSCLEMRTTTADLTNLPVS